MWYSMLNNLFMGWVFCDYVHLQLPVPIKIYIIKNYVKSAVCIFSTHNKKQVSGPAQLILQKMNL